MIWLKRKIYFTLFQILFQILVIQRTSLNPKRSLISYLKGRILYVLSAIVFTIYLILAYLATLRKFKLHYWKNYRRNIDFENEICTFSNSFSTYNWWFWRFNYVKWKSYFGLGSKRQNVFNTHKMRCELALGCTHDT